MEDMFKEASAFDCSTNHPSGLTLVATGCNN